MIFSTHFCYFLSDFLTFFGRLFGANRRTFVELFWHAFSRFARARAFRQQRTTRTGQFWKPRARAPSGTFCCVFWSFLGAFLHRFWVVFLAHFGSFFAIFCRFLSLFCRCCFATFSYFWAVFCARFEASFFTVVCPIFA